ncbi:alkaline phosphatase family protein [Sphingobacterium sp.]|uniref:alkaline phosphatase family protein n=1 Tax=Sphingobacterium sp. TaxID=341027 RepID=UPI002898135D|nr:alkaline phosphatase family protein [Sphingobacterium sp.]
MKKNIIKFLICCTLGLASAFSTLFAQTKSILIIFDGLRPDFINQEHMPNLFDLANKGSVALNSHSVFPTVTRVNSASLSTGSYPEKHGILGNTIHIADVDARKNYNTGNKSDLEIVKKQSKLGLLSNLTVAELLKQENKTFAVYSSGSSGQAFLQDPQEKGWTVNPEFIFPLSFRDSVFQTIASIESQKQPKFANHKWVVDAFLAFGLDKKPADITTVWLSEPDSKQHGFGIGSPEALEAIKFMDEQLGRILLAIKEKGLEDKVNVLVSADHGFVTYAGEHTVKSMLEEEGLGDDLSNGKIVMADGAIFVKDKDQAKVERIVKLLQKQPWIGPIFTKSKNDTDLKGSVDGTFSFASIHWNHPDRAADILVTYSWDDVPNEFGYKGSAYNKSGGAAGHGGISSFEINTNLVLYGPSFKKSYQSTAPTSYIDIMPTLFTVLGVKNNHSMQGRVLTEFFKNKNVDANKGKQYIETAQNKEKNYTVELKFSEIDGHKYLDYGRRVK